MTKRSFNLIHIDRIRAWIQGISFFALMYGGTLGLSLGSFLPVMSCVYASRDLRGGICYLTSLQVDISRPFWQLVSPIGFFALISFLGFILLIFLFNRTWCGFICPIGTLQDFISAIRKRLFTPGIRFSETTLRRLSPVKYAFLAIVLLFPLLTNLGVLPREFIVSFCYLCPVKMVGSLLSAETRYWTILSGSIGSMILTTVGMIITGLFVTGVTIKSRFWCFFCPLGCLQYLAAKRSLLKLEKNGDACTRCGNCSLVCDMDIREIADDVSNPDIITDRCIVCMKCISACPEDDALHLTIAGRPVLSSSEAGFIKRMEKDPSDHAH